MPTHLVKRSPDKDEYLRWSTITDSPLGRVMSREEVVSGDYGHDLERTDRLGCSAISGWYDWDGSEGTFWDWKEGHPGPAGANSVTYSRGELFDAVSGQVRSSDLAAVRSRMIAESPSSKYVRCGNANQYAPFCVLDNGHDGDCRCPAGEIPGVGLVGLSSVGLWVIIRESKGGYSS